MSEIAIFDTSVLVDQIRSNRHLDGILELEGLVRNCAVVLAELWRGATSPVDRKILQALEKNHPILTPTEKNWLESGKILAKIQADQGFEPRKLRELHFDVLIALTARSHGAKLITSNRDFYYRASSGSIALLAAGYRYDGNWVSSIGWTCTS